MDRVQLMYDLEKTSLELDILIKQARILALQLGVEEFAFQDTSGGLVLAPLVTAKANALSALAMLQKEN